MVAVARGPTPSTATTVPRPYLSCETRLPTANSSTGPDPSGRLPVEDDDFSPNRLAVIGADREPQPPPEDPPPEELPKPRPPRPPNARPLMLPSKELSPMNPPDLASSSVRRHSTRSFGMSSRNRDAGLAPGCPQADRIIARET